jgi:hypothetical protein
VVSIPYMTGALSIRSLGALRDYGEFQWNSSFRDGQGLELLTQPGVIGSRLMGIVLCLVQLLAVALLEIEVLGSSVDILLRHKVLFGWREGSYRTLILHLVESPIRIVGITGCRI